MNHEILRRPLAELTDIAFHCACGHDHSIKIGALEIGPGASTRVAALARPYGARPACRGCQHVRRAGRTCACPVEGRRTRRRRLRISGASSAPGRLRRRAVFLEASDEKGGYGLLIAVGSGVLNDITRPSADVCICRTSSSAPRRPWTGTRAALAHCLPRHKDELLLALCRRHHRRHGRHEPRAARDDRGGLRRRAGQVYSAGGLAPGRAGARRVPLRADFRLHARRARDLRRPPRAWRTATPTLWDV